MESLTSPLKPPLVLVRSTKAYLFLYGFGDASGSGFGFASQFGDSDTIDFQFGRWTCSVVSETSSNYKEFTNFVDAIEELGLNGKLYGAVAFCGTDSMVMDRAYHKGYSSSKPLDKQVVQLRNIVLTYTARSGCIMLVGQE